MKVSTRIIAGYVILILVTVAVFSYQVYMIQQLNEINKKLAGVNVNNFLTSLYLKYHEGLIEDGALKYYGTRYAQYLDQFQTYGGDLEKDLRELKNTATSEAELAAIDKANQTWKTIQETIGSEEELKPSDNPERAERLNNQ